MAASLVSAKTYETPMSLPFSNRCHTFRSSLSGAIVIARNYITVHAFTSAKQAMQSTTTSLSKSMKRRWDVGGSSFFDTWDFKR
jgi:hypothetical protein